MQGKPNTYPGRLAFITLLLLVPVLLPPPSTGLGGTGTGNTTLVRVDIALGAPASNSLEARIQVSQGEAGYTCSGVVEKNYYYRETRALSKNLLVIPIYYLLDKTCPRLLATLSSPAPGGTGLMSLSVHVPPGYGILSGMDMRGYGGWGNYTLPLHMFQRHYLYDSLVVFSEKTYQAVAVNNSLAVVYPANTSKALVKAVAVTVLAVENFLSQELGPSPRSPVVVVLAAPGEHPYTGGFHYSTGSVIYISLARPPDVLELVHAAAHEAVHGWLNHGLLWGTDYLVSEGTTEYLAMMALHHYYPDIARRIDERIISLYVSAKSRYGLGLLANAGLREAALQLCGHDAYIEALRALLAERLNKPLQNLEPISFEDLVGATTSSCRNTTGRELLEVVAPLLLIRTLGGKIGEAKWPYIGKSEVEDVLGEVRKACSHLSTRVRGEQVKENASIVTSNNDGIGKGSDNGTTRGPYIPNTTDTGRRCSDSDRGEILPMALASIIALVVLVAYAACASAKKTAWCKEPRIE